MVQSLEVEGVDIGKITRLPDGIYFHDMVQYMMGMCVYRYLYIYMYTVIWPTYIYIIYIYIYMLYHDLYQPRLRPPPLLMAVEVYIYTSLYVHITYSSFVGNDHDEMGHPFLANQPAKSCVGDFIATVRFCPFVYAHILYCMYIYIHIYTYVCIPIYTYR